MDDTTRDDLTAFMADHNLTLADVIDVTVETNGITGVGLITLADDVAKYIKDQIT